MSQDYLRGIEHGLEPGIPDIKDQPWKVLEVAMGKADPWDRPRLYHDWQLLYKPGSPSKRQKLDLADWGLTTAKV
jgi:hypothetical protein